MKINNCEINVLVAGRRVREFKSPMDFQTYIEGRDGSNFEIEFVNNNGFDVEAILSVDGLSITDGKPAGDQSSGYVVPARGKVSIPGWTVDGGTAAQFFFSGTKGGSYVEQAGGDSRNKGVIGAKVYGRKANHNYNFNPHAKLMSATTWPTGTRGVMGSTTGGVASSPQYQAFGATLTCSNAAAMNATATAQVSAKGLNIEQQAEVDEVLGTGFGQATDFNTTTVDFERGDNIAMIVLYYASASALKKKGIDVTQEPAKRPSAFPANEPEGCAPPAGWSR